MDWVGWWRRGFKGWVKRTRKQRERGREGERERGREGERERGREGERENEIWRLGEIGRVIYEQRWKEVVLRKVSLFFILDLDISTISQITSLDDMDWYIPLNDPSHPSPTPD